MEKEPQNLRSHERWAHFRFSVIGPLLAAPPAHGQLQGQLEALCAKSWRHPLSGRWIRLGYSTIERWYYKAQGSPEGPVQVLQRKIRSDQGTHPALSPQVAELLAGQYRQHPSWSYQLHADNLTVLVEQQPPLGPAPAYVSVLRYMKSHGLIKRPRRGPVHSPGAQAAERRYEAREIRGYESEYVNGLWHLDFHHGSRRVLLPSGQWVYPLLLGVLDDHSRLCCHAQWYLAEGAEDLCHGLSQAFQKRQLPRALMSDNGSANGDGEGSICYPYYPSREHFCRPARGQDDFIDCVNLDGWTLDFLCARKMGLVEGRKIYGYGGRNGMEGLRLWLTEIRKRWPDTKLITQGEFGELWRARFKNNDELNFRFVHRGSGIRASEADQEIRWFMNRDFRLALLSNWKENGTPKVIDFTRYELPAKEPADPEPGKHSRNWSLINRINQKGTRPQDQPVALTELTTEEQSLIRRHYPKLFTSGPNTE